ncbi:MAG: glutamate synthase large subunit [Gammaproteobacteria bacterium]|nr:MAG: glutamate synthase large subunit [Gammaproteobacteria bacterium]
MKNGKILKKPGKIGLYDPSYEKDSCGVGMVANIKGIPSRQIMDDAYLVNSRMDHRGGCGFEENTGDGAGILIAIPNSFFKEVSKTIQIKLPEKGSYAVGNIFLPKDANEKRFCKKEIEKIIDDEGQEFLAWREVPIQPKEANVGPAAILSQPSIEQLFIKSRDVEDQEDFERKLYLIRKRFSHRLRTDMALNERSLLFACSLSSKIIVYKGMLTPSQLFPFYTDLQQENFETHLAMVHSRFSTNTFPSWDRAQPNRYMCHNGEINTLKGNVNLIGARQGVAYSDLFGDKLKDLFPIAEPDSSDSGNFDNILEFLMLTGRSLQESVMMMIPEAWQSNHLMNEEKRAFYEYSSSLMEPWDGPASIVFTDGNYIGAVLDRNGLRPSRYYVTKDDKVIMASEVGVLPVEPSNVLMKGRLQPGKMFLIDFEEGKMVPDEEIKEKIYKANPFKKWVKDQVVPLEEITNEETSNPEPSQDLISRMKAFGYTVETMQFMLLPIVKELRDPLGSMGNDAALACLSDKPRLIFDYFKQLFAQVTNPAIDSIREEVIMSLECLIGPEGNLLSCNPENAHRLRIKNPIISDRELSSIQNLNNHGWKTKTIDITYKKENGNKKRMLSALDRICKESEEAIKQGYSFIVLSDRKLGSQRIALSSLLACSTVHHHLIGEEKRTRIGIIVETGEAREVHHHCLLIGYGADAINPYMAFESLWQARQDGLLDQISFNEMVKAYKKGVAKGILKVMAKMGISTLQSYKGAQIFEAVGLANEIIEKCFPGTASRVQGVDFDILINEMERRHELGFPLINQENIEALPNPGDFHWRQGGDSHMWDPETISDLQQAARNNNEDSYWKFSKYANKQTTKDSTLRGLLKFKYVKKALYLNEVEAEKEIVKRFATGAMSLGSISTEAHESLAIAMNKLGGKSNTGEGGEDPIRFKPQKDGVSKRSAIKQVASGRFGVTMWYLTNSDELQIKIAQGAKPGEGGELPGRKVDDYIAKIRHSTPGVGLISPPPHHDIYSIEDIAQLIHDLKNANREARISVKLVSEIGVGTIAAGVVKAKTDHLVIAGHDGGTGASPLTSIKHAGLPWELGIAETHQTLVMNNLRSRVVLQTDGQIKTGRDVAIAALLGAEEFGFATAPLITLGCIMMRKCHLNTCPVGIATQDKELRKKFKGDPEHVINYLFMVAKELRMIMAELGFRTVNEMIGRVDCLEVDGAINHWKRDGLDFSSILHPAEIIFDNTEVFNTQSQDHGLDKALDLELLKKSKKAINKGEKVDIEMPVKNTNRVVGTILSNEVSKVWEDKGLPEDTINIKLNGSAGQSLASWLTKGITITLEGDANDYVGKGLSGGKLIVYPPKESSFKSEENILIGNVALYGATAGEAYFSGVAAERFCVRNSGAKVVIEGIGDHGCEYMTGGRAVILGPTGRNFGAGMSGGIAYVYDPENNFKELCNLDTFELENLEIKEDIKELKLLIENHSKYTGSEVSKKILANWKKELALFKKVMPTDYKRVLQEVDKKEKKAG